MKAGKTQTNTHPMFVPMTEAERAKYSAITDAEYKEFGRDVEDGE